MTDGTSLVLMIHFLAMRLKRPGRSLSSKQLKAFQDLRAKYSWYSKSKNNFSFATESLKAIVEQWTDGGWTSGMETILASPLKEFALYTHALGVEELRTVILSLCFHFNGFG